MLSKPPRIDAAGARSACLIRGVTTNIRLVPSIVRETASTPAACVD